MTPSSVQLVNSTSATRHGSTNTESRGSFGPEVNGLLSRRSGFSRLPSSSSVRSVKPVPTRPA